MRERKDVLNAKLSTYDTFVNSLYKTAYSNRVAWNIPASALTSYSSLLAKWNSKWATSQIKKSSSTVDRTATSTARKKLTKFLRPFVQIYIMRNAELTDAHIIKCGLQPYKKTKTKIGAPKSSPSMYYKLRHSHSIEAYFRQAPGEDGSTNRGKPLHVAYCKIAWFIGDNPPANPEDYPKSVMSSKSPQRISFKADDAGKKVTFIACWVSMSNLEGDWCAPRSMHIP